MGGGGGIIGTGMGLPPTCWGGGGGLHIGGGGAPIPEGGGLIITEGGGGGMFDDGGLTGGLNCRIWGRGGITGGGRTWPGCCG